MEISAELVKHRDVSGGQPCTQEELEMMLKDSYPVENRAAHGKEKLKINFVGTLQQGNRLYSVYQDKEGFCWNSVLIITDHGPVSEYEAIFGHPEKCRRSHKRSPLIRSRIYLPFSIKKESGH